MAVFGAPIAHGDDAERAVRAGSRVLEGIERAERDARPRPGGARGRQHRRGDRRASAPTPGEALAIGDVVNTASRLQTAAPAGRLLVGEETHRATRHAIRYEALAPIDAKGKAEAVPAWLAVEPVVAARRAPARGAPARRPRP